LLFLFDGHQYYVSEWIKVFDPYPFILLNLILSCLAAFASPIDNDEPKIGRSEKRRERSKTDYMVI